jgi:hypothetical protein
LAKELGMEPAHLREMKSGRRPPNQKVAAALGWELRWVRKVYEGQGRPRNTKGE